MTEEKQYWSLDELVELTDKVQEKEVEYREKLVKFQWCELAESEEPKIVGIDDSLTDDERNDKYMELGKERTLLMMKKADDKNPEGPSLISAWEKIPSTLKYQISNLVMGVTNNPNE
tara:strand:- start:1350 stop:1700 length:351 start_codon:yes stop_codon:yes gene_type:complete